MIDLEELRRAYEGTTQGEWAAANKSVRVTGTQQSNSWGKSAPNGPQGGVCNCLGHKWVSGADDHAKANATFIATAHNQWPAIMAELAELRAENERLRIALRKAKKVARAVNDSGSFTSQYPVQDDKNYFFSLMSRDTYNALCEVAEQEANHEVQ